MKQFNLPRFLDDVLKLLREIPLILDLAFPNNEDPPMEFLERLPISPITVGIAGKLSLPELLPRFWSIGIRTTVAMPEAAMNEDRQAISHKYDIRLARKIPTVKPEAITQPVQGGPQSAFRFSIQSPNTGHVPASPLRRKLVDHTAVLRQESHRRYRRFGSPQVAERHCRPARIAA